MAIPSNSVRPTRQDARYPEVCLSLLGWWMIPPPSDEYAIPFLRIVGSLQEWCYGVISDRDLARCLRKAAAEVQRGY